MCNGSLSSSPGRPAAAPQTPHHHPRPGFREGPGPEPRNHRRSAEQQVRQRYHLFLPGGGKFLCLVTANLQI